MADIQSTDQPANPITYRQGYRLRPSRRLLLGVSLWLVIGLFALYSDIVRRAGGATGWVYLLVILLMLPTVLSHIELRSWIPVGQGSYRLIKAMERSELAFLTGWIYLLGWGAISGLLAFSAGSLASTLITEFVAVEVNPLWLASGILVIYTAAMLMNIEPWLRFAEVVTISVLLLIVVSMVILAGRFIFAPEFIAQVSTGSGAFFEGVGLVIAAMWILEAVTALEGHTDSPRTSLLAVFSGPLIAGLFALLAWAAAPPANSLNLIAGSILPETGASAALAIEVLVILVSLYVFSYITQKELQSIGDDGAYAAWLTAPNRRYGTPTGLTILMGVLSLTAAAAASLLNIIVLAQVAAFVFLVMQIGVNVAAIVLARQPRAQNRTIVLPAWPSIPASGAAICFLLLFALSPQALAVGVVWIILGVIYYLQQGRETIRKQQLGRTVFQAVPSDVRSSYPVVVPVSNPETFANLVNFGASIAKARDGHLTLVQIVQVPEDQELEEQRKQAEAELDVLHLSLEMARQLGVRVEGVVRLSRSIQQGIIDTINEERARLVVMGWHGQTNNDGSTRLGSIINEVLENAACDVAIIHGTWGKEVERILVPVGGGPHAPIAAALGLSLTPKDTGSVGLLNVVRPSAEDETLERSQNVLTGLRDKLTDRGRIDIHIKFSESAVQGILSTAEEYDALLFGASGSAFFMEQSAFGRLQFQVTRQLDKPVALIRGYTGLSDLVIRRTWQSASDLLPRLSIEEQAALLEKMRTAATPNINYHVLIVLSAMIATLGLLLNSAAVIIGAMLVAPLMGPIVASGLGIARGDLRTFRNGLSATLQGLLSSVFLAILLTLISPVAAATPEVLSRTQPTLLDLLVGLVSGAAGAYAQGRREVGDALPGVAIAAALMPPICVIGIGVALGRVDIATGALLLFVTNLFSIIVAAAMVFLLLGVRPPQRADRQRQFQQSLRISLLSLAAISLPLGIILFTQVERDQFRSDTEAIVRENISTWGDVELVELQVNYGVQSIMVDATLYSSGETLEADVSALETLLNERTRRTVEVDFFIIEGVRLDSGPETLVFPEEP